ncbi:hypothetical protein [Nonomuraea sp. 10N515B]|uniref:hypothetical protein n=1 Tax=Nonomuraea sp. 10N515B TaxID=3457422 RepID=UPI003FCDB5BD
MAVIDVTDLTKRYADHTVLNGISFSVEEGEIFGLLGPNGTGKPISGLGRSRFGNDAWTC